MADLWLFKTRRQRRCRFKGSAVERQLRRALLAAITRRFFNYFNAEIVCGMQMCVRGKDVAALQLRQGERCLLLPTLATAAVVFQN